MADTDVLNAKKGDCCDATNTPAISPQGVEPNTQAYLDWLKDCKETQATKIEEIETALEEAGNDDATTSLLNWAGEPSPEGSKIITVEDFISLNTGHNLEYVEGDGSDPLDPCKPALLTEQCLIDSYLETEAPAPIGIRWYSRPGSADWRLLGFSPLKVRSYSERTPQINLSDADLAGIFAAGDFVTIGTVSAPYTNEDKVPHRVEGIYRTNETAQVDAPSNINTVINPTGDGVPILATPSVVTSVDNGHVGFFRVNRPPLIGKYVVNSIVQPGESVLISFELSTRINSYTPNAGNLYGVGSNVIEITAQRSMT